MCWLSKVLIAASFHVPGLFKQQANEQKLTQGSKQKLKSFAPQKERYRLRWRSCKDFSFFSLFSCVFPVCHEQCEQNVKYALKLLMERKGHTHVCTPSLSLSLVCVYIVCLYEHVQRDPSPRMLTCGTNLFAQKFQEGKVINSHKFNLFIKHSLSGVTAQTIIKELQQIKNINQSIIKSTRVIGFDRNVLKVGFDELFWVVSQRKVCAQWPIKTKIQSQISAGGLLWLLQFLAQQLRVIHRGSKQCWMWLWFLEKPMFANI